MHFLLILQECSKVSKNFPKDKALENASKSFCYANGSSKLEVT